MKDLMKIVSAFGMMALIATGNVCVAEDSAKMSSEITATTHVVLPIPIPIPGIPGGGGTTANGGGGGSGTDPDPCSSC